jgi:hypothetical protein
MKKTPRRNEDAKAQETRRQTQQKMKKTPRRNEDATAQTMAGEQTQTQNRLYPRRVRVRTPQ